MRRIRRPSMFHVKHSLKAVDRPYGTLPHSGADCKTQPSKLYTLPHACPQWLQARTRPQVRPTPLPATSVQSPDPRGPIPRCAHRRPRSAQPSQTLRHARPTPLGHSPVPIPLPTLAPRLTKMIGAPRPRPPHRRTALPARTRIDVAPHLPPRRSRAPRGQSRLPCLRPPGTIAAAYPSVAARVVPQMPSVPCHTLWPPLCRRPLHASRFTFHVKHHRAALRRRERPGLPA